MSYIGTSKVGGMYLGDTKIAKAYLGDDLVYSSEPTVDYSSTDGWEFGYRFNGGGKVAAAPCCITRYYEVQPGDVIRYSVGDSGYNQGIRYNTSSGSNEFLQWADGSRVTAPSGCVSIAFTMATSKIATCYLLNTTTGQYLYKGKNV